MISLTNEELIFIQLYDDWFYSHWFRNFNSVQSATHNTWEILRNLGYIYDALQHNINWKMQKFNFLKNQKVLFKEKICFLSHDFYQPQ